MKRVVLLCGELFHGVSDSLVGPMEILIEGNHIANRQQISSTRHTDQVRRGNGLKE